MPAAPPSELPPEACSISAVIPPDEIAIVPVEFIVPPDNPVPAVILVTPAASAGNVTVFVFTAVTCPSVDVVILSIAVNVPPCDGEAVELLFVLVTASCVILIVGEEESLAVNVPDPPKTPVPSTVSVPLLTVGIVGVPDKLE